jgi:hypothetical protein
MNRNPIMRLTLIILLIPVIGFAAPVGNIGDPLLWTPGPLQKESGLSLVTGFILDFQKNDLPEQLTRFPWTNPDTLPPEERHYPQWRWSNNSLKTYGVKIGVPYKDVAVIYTVLGMSEADVDFYFKDRTVSWDFMTGSSFTSGPDLFYGIGAGIVIQRGEYYKVPLTLGMDVSYRRYSVDEDKQAANGTAYKANLDEVQLAFCLSAEAGNFSPYVGFKVASITGHETYINRNFESSYYGEGYIHYNQNITWSKDIGYFIGVTTSMQGKMSLGIEVRGGDERAFGVNATKRF